VWRAMDVLLVAVPDGRRLALERLQSPAARRLLERARIRSPDDVAGYYADRFAALRPAAHGAPLNRDDRPIVEYRAPRDLVAVGRTGPGSAPRVLGLVPFATTRPTGPLFAAWSEEGWYETRARLLIARGDLVRAGATAGGARAAGLARLADRLDQEVAAGARRQRGLAAIERARQLLAAGREQEGQGELRHAAELDPANGRTWLMLADRLRLSGAFVAAESAITRGSASADPEVPGRGRRGRGHAGDEPGATARGGEALPRGGATESAAGQELRARGARLERRGDRAAAREAIRRGLASLPGDPTLVALQAELGVDGR